MVPEIPPLIQFKRDDHRKVEKVAIQAAISRGEEIAKNPWTQLVKVGSEDNRTQVAIDCAVNEVYNLECHTRTGRGAKLVYHECYYNIIISCAMVCTSISMKSTKADPNRGQKQ